MRKRVNANLLLISTILKYCIPVFIYLIAFHTVGNICYSVIGILETIVLFLCVNSIAKKKLVIARVVSIIPLFVLCIQAALLLFAGRYVNTLMLSNLSSAEALSGKTLQYGGTILLIVLVELLPLKYIDFAPINQKKYLVSMVAVLVTVDVIICSIFHVAYSPVGSLSSLMIEYQNMRKLDDIINSGDGSSSYEKFYRTSVDDYISRPENLSERPNVVLIFMEGCSQNIVDDSRQIMPNIASFQNQGINFSNYFNHTAATYRGLIGQLYSAHQFHNTDTNRLISVQEIFKDYGYDTEFINSEPKNEEFSEYLGNLGFDSVSSSAPNGDYVSDSEIYDMLYNSLVEADESNTPRLIVTYTFGTHCAMDSEEQQFGDGSNRLLNRFFNTDYQFGLFLERVQADNLDENTLIVLTTDHATVLDDDFIETFQDVHDREYWFCDTIPLTFYYKGICPETIDANGRNSICLADTLLDYLDFSAPNFFLGESLFGIHNENNLFSTTYCIPEGLDMLTTQNGTIDGMPDERKQEFEEELAEYLSLVQ